MNRFVSSLGACLITGIAVLMALFVAGCAGKADLHGNWYIVTQDGKPMAVAQPVIELKEGGKYISSSESGTYTVDGNTITTHKELINGKNKEENLAAWKKKTKGDPTLMAKYEKAWDDVKMTVSPDGGTLTVTYDGKKFEMQKTSQVK